MFQFLIEEVRSVVEAVSPAKKKARHRALGKALHKGANPLKDTNVSMHDGQAREFDRENPSDSDLEKHGRDARRGHGVKVGAKRGEPSPSKAYHGDKLAKRTDAGGVSKQDRNTRSLAKGATQQAKNSRKEFGRHGMTFGGPKMKLPK
jgi:hypothetical protein